MQQQLSGGGTQDPTIQTPNDFANVLLGRLGAPDSPDNVADIDAWEKMEGGNWSNPDAYNPLDTTQSEPGSESTNGNGVQKYTSWNEGISATVATLENGDYGSIVSDLQQGNVPISQFSELNELATWGTQVGGWPSASDLSGGYTPSVESSLYYAGSEGVGVSGSAGGSSSGSSTGSSSSASTAPAGSGGIGNVLDSLNSFLNPAAQPTITSIVTGNIEQTLLEIVGRGIFTIGGLVLIYLGIKQFTGSGGSGIIQIAQTQQRESRLRSGQSQDAAIAQLREDQSQRREALEQARESRLAAAQEDNFILGASKASAAHKAATAKQTEAQAKAQDAQTRADKAARAAKPRRETKAQKENRRIRAHEAVTKRVNAVNKVKPKREAKSVVEDAAKGLME